MYKKVRNFAVLGAGNGGQALAAYLALQGYKVNLFNRSLERIKTIKKLNGIHLCGLFEGFGNLNKITTDIGEAIADSEVIMVVTPAIAHKYLAQILSPYLKNGQIVILNPGRTGGALEFYNTLQKNKCQAEVVISEAQTFLYASRVIKPGWVKIMGVKNKVSIAALPATKTREVIEKIIPVFPQFTPVENILKTSLDNIGAIFHPAPALLNMAWIESTSGAFTYYHNGITASVAKVLEKIDQERMAVTFALGIEPTSAKDWLRMSYGVQGNSLYQLLQNNRQYTDIDAPATIKNRYIFEDVPMSLVPIASIGEMLSIDTPTIDMIVNLANIIHETNYWEVGRTAKSLGLKGLSISEIKRLVNKGYTRQKKILSQVKEPFMAGFDNIVFTKIGDFQNGGGIET